MLESQPGLQANTWKYYLFHLFLNLQLWFPIWIIYLTEKRGLTLAQVTLIDIPFWLNIILLQIPAAAIADRFGRKPTLIAAAAFFSGAVVFFGLASTFWLLLGSYLVWGIGFALLYGTESAFIYDSLKGMGREEEYPRIYGRGWAVATAAGVAATLIGAPLAAETSLQFPIIFSGGIAACAVLVAMTFQEPAAVVRTHHPSYGEILRESAAIVRRQPQVRYAIFFYGVMTVGSVAVVFFSQPFLVDHGVDVGDVGYWQTPMRIAGIAGAFFAHRILRDLGERWTFYLMPLISVPAYVALATIDSRWAMAAFPVINFAVILSQPTVTDYLNRRVPSEQRATVMSLTNLIRSVVLIPAAPMMGLLAQEAGTSAAYWAGGAVIAALGLPLLLLWMPSLGGAGERESLEPVPTGD